MLNVLFPSVFSSSCNGTEGVLGIESLLTETVVFFGIDDSMFICLSIKLSSGGKELVEVFFMQKLSGKGLAFVEIDGSVMEYQLAAGESMLINTGYLAAMSESCKLKVETVAGLKNKFFGGEGFFNTAVSGPGHVWIQTMPANKMAGALRPYIPNGD